MQQQLKEEVARGEAGAKKPERFNHNKILVNFTSDSLQKRIRRLTNPKQATQLLN